LDHCNKHVIRIIFDRVITNLAEGSVPELPLILMEISLLFSDDVLASYNKPETSTFRYIGIDIEYKKGSVRQLILFNVPIRLGVKYTHESSPSTLEPGTIFWNDSIPSSTGISNSSSGSNLEFWRVEASPEDGCLA